MKLKLALVITLMLSLLPVSRGRMQVLNLRAGVTDATARERRISEAAEALRAQLVAQRRDFHMHPELSNREERTSRIVAERLRALGLEEVKTGVGKYGVTALLKGGKPGTVVAVRSRRTESMRRSSQANASPRCKQFAAAG
ncbi:MAG TPA: hypothetical protein VGC91_09870 [Pyrinomonadaceae bacterium]|jgi:hypothetical protein